MGFQDQSIKRKTLAVIMLTSVLVLLVAAAAFTVYDLVMYRQHLAEDLSATAAIIADHSAEALRTGDKKDARATLVSLHADPRIVAAALYDDQGNVFAGYPARAPASAFPKEPVGRGRRFEEGRLILFEPVMDQGNRVGELYLKSNLRPVVARLYAYGSIALLVLFGSALVALVISNSLQKRITRPILALAEVARAVSERGDYSIRARKLSEDETGLLTDAFNGMLTRIETQTETLRQNEEIRSFVAAIVESSDDAIAGKDLEGKVVSWNSGAERMFGYTAAEMIGRPITRIQPAERPSH